VEIRGNRVFPAMTGGPINIIQSENLYDGGQAVRVMVVDRPLEGEFIGSTPKTDETSPRMAANGPSEYLSTCPMVENDFVEKISKLRKTFLLLPGYETVFAGRIKELANTTASQLLRYLRPPVPELSLVRADIERVAYASLHAFVFGHLRKVLGENDMLNLGDGSELRVELVLRERQAPSDIFPVLDKLIPNVKNRICPEFDKLQKAITPQQKLNYLSNITETLGTIFQDTKIEHCSTEHLLAGMAIAFVIDKCQHARVHVAHMEMYLAAHPELAMEKCSFAFATFNSCVEFLGKAIIP
jgi:hypothetical protein